MKQFNVFESHIGFQSFRKLWSIGRDSPVDDFIDAVGNEVVSFDRIECERIECLFQQSRRLIFAGLVVIGFITLVPRTR